MDVNEVVRQIVSAWPLFKRDFPWRRVNDPWLALAAEVLLIQTDAPKVLAAWPKFVQKFPNPCAILEVPREEVEAILRPLGLYRQRAERLIKMAEYLKAHYNCRVPCDYNKLSAVPGVGDYIAAAVAIVACGQSAPVLDTNIARIFSRIYLGKDPPKRYMYDKALWRITGQVSWSKDAFLAMLDFAAVICTAKNPSCSQCPVKQQCQYTMRT